MKMSGENGLLFATSNRGKWERVGLRAQSRGEEKWGGQVRDVQGRKEEGPRVDSPLNDWDQRPGYNSSNYTLEIAVIVQ